MSRPSDASGWSPDVTTKAPPRWFIATTVLLASYAVQAKYGSGRRKKKKKKKKLESHYQSRRLHYHLRKQVYDDVEDRRRGGNAQIMEISRQD